MYVGTALPFGTKATLLNFGAAALIQINLVFRFSDPPLSDRHQEHNRGAPCSTSRRTARARVRRTLKSQAPLI